MKDILRTPTIFLLLIIVGVGYGNIYAQGNHRDSVVTEFFGTKVSDPYRWLEDNNSPDVKDWINQQNKNADEILSGFPEETKIESRVKELAGSSSQQFSPKLVNGKLYFEKFTPPQGQPVVVYETWPEGETKVLVDPNKEGKGIAVTGFWPSPKGNYLAYTTAEGGTEAATIHILDIKGNKNLTDSLSYAGGGATPAGMVWDDDEGGLTYVRLPLPGTVPDSASQFFAALYHHTLNHPFSDDKTVFGQNLSKVAEYTFMPSETGKLAAMFLHYGDGNPDFVYIRKGSGEWKMVMDTSANVRVADEVNSGASWNGDNSLLVISYQNAPKGKLVSISPDGQITQLVTQENWAYNAVTAIKGGFLIVKVNGPDWKIDQYNNAGKMIRTVNLPKTGIGISSIAGSGKSDQVLIDYSGWTIPEKWILYNTNNGRIKTVFEEKPGADYSKVKYSVIDAISKDGTKIPVTIIRIDTLKPDGKRPAIVEAYGGFGIPTRPYFIGSNLLWLENGGILAYANIRGGGEFGEGWHEAGMLDKKQNVFDDMYASAESLVKNKWTDSQHLGLLGGSNGGLLMGAELTQHPEAFKAVASFVGIYDMVRTELFPNGQYNISEYGTSTNEKDFKWLIAYSPYHNIKPHTSYPAVLLETGMNDPRVASWQSRKFAAALENANTSDNPIILITRMNEGHGVTSSFSQRVGNYIAQMTFFAHELGLNMTEKMKKE